MSKKHKTNTELVDDFMNFSQNGALAQIFVMHALDEFAKAVVKNDGKDWSEFSFISFPAWQRTAQEWLNAHDNNSLKTIDAFPIASQNG
jgi:hypothetical protein